MKKIWLLSVLLMLTSPVMAEDNPSTIAERLNDIENIHIGNSDLQMDIDADRSFLEILSSVEHAVEGIENMLTTLRESDENEKIVADFKKLLWENDISTEKVSSTDYFKHPFFNRNWETHNLGAPNWLQHIRIDLVHLEAKYLEEYIKLNPNDIEAKSRFDSAMERLTEYARTAIHVD